MSYTTHEWVDGETITAAKLNNIEEGIGEASQQGGGGLTLVPLTYDTTGSLILGMTCQEILAGMLAGNLYAIHVQQSMMSDWSLSEGVHVFLNFRDDTQNGNGVYLDGFYYNAYASTMADYPSIYVGD